MDTDEPLIANDERPEVALIANQNPEIRLDVGNTANELVDDLKPVTDGLANDADKSEKFVGSIADGKDREVRFSLLDRMANLPRFESLGESANELMDIAKQNDILDVLINGYCERGIDFEERTADLHQVYVLLAGSEDPSDIRNFGVKLRARLGIVGKQNKRDNEGRRVVSGIRLSAEGRKLLACLPTKSQWLPCLAHERSIARNLFAHPAGQHRQVDNGLSHLFANYLGRDTLLDPAIARISEQRMAQVNAKSGRIFLL